MFLKNIYLLFVIFLLTFINLAFSQTVDAYNKKEEESKTSFLDPSRFTINHSISFGMLSSSQTSGLKSQSLYTTMLSYKFSQPVTLNLNFSLPIHSTYSSELNLNMENIESLDYFKNMPFDASIIWQPKENFTLQLSIIRNTQASSLYYPFSSYYSPLNYLEK